MTSLAGAARDRLLASRRFHRGGQDRLLVGGAVGVALLIAAWVLLAGRQPDFILPSPVETWVALLGLLADGTLYTELARTALRSVTGVLLALLIGGAWGILNGTSTWAAAISRPAVSVLMAVPPVVIVAVGLVWFGPGGTVTRLVIILVALPLIVIATQEAVRNVDRDLLEMASVFNLSRWSVLRHVIAPAVASPVLAATSVTLGQAIRVAVMAELLSATDGIGAEVALARTNLATADLMAWALVLIIAVIAIEGLVLRPLTARLLRWRTASSTT